MRPSSNGPSCPNSSLSLFLGVKTSRDDFLVDIDRDALTRRMETYFDPKVSHEELRRIAPGVMANTPRFRAEAVRDELRERGFLKKNIVRYCYRPFDVRWLYWEPETKLLDEKRKEYFLHVFDGNPWMVAQQKPRRGMVGTSIHSFHWVSRSHGPRRKLLPALAKAKSGPLVAV